MTRRGEEMATAQPSLFITVASWLRKHGKQVKLSINEEQKHELQQCFRLMDSDGSGAIDAHELNNAFKLLGINLTSKEIKELVQQVDHDHTGDIGWSEFLEIMMHTLQQIAEDPDSGQKSYQLPFALMSTQYRRKRYMDNLLSGTKEGFSAMVRAAEQYQQESNKAPSQSESRHQLSPPRSPRRTSRTSSLPRHSQSHGHADPDAAPTHSNHARQQQQQQEGLVRSTSGPYSGRPGTAPAVALSSAAGTAAGAAHRASQRGVSSEAAAPRLSTRQARLQALYQSWLEQGGGRGKMQRKGGGALKPVQSDRLFSAGVSDATLQQLLEIPQANLDLSFSSSTIKVPRGTSSGPIPHSATAAAPAPHSSASAATTGMSAAQLRPFSAPLRRATAPTQLGTSTQGIGGGEGAWRQGLGRPASALPRAAYAQGGAAAMTTHAQQRQQQLRAQQQQQQQQQQRQERQRPFSAQARYSAAPVAGRSVQQAWAASNVAPFLMATQLVPERSTPGACARERSWAYADARR